MLVPEVGTASDQVALASGYGGEASTDDLYMEGISIRRGFASEFIELLEVGGGEGSVGLVLSCLVLGKVCLVLPRFVLSTSRGTTWRHKYVA